MAAFEPFEPNVKSGTAGFTITVTATAGNTGTTQILDSTNGFAPSILVVNNVSAAVGPTYIRLSVESSTVAASTVSITDVPMLANTVRLFANPNPAGKTACTVLASVTTGAVYFVPGQGGDV